jgi:hypothetical protein
MPNCHKFHLLLLQIYYTLSGFRGQCCESNGLMWFKSRAKKNKFVLTLRRQVLPSPVGCLNWMQVDAVSGQTLHPHGVRKQKTFLYKYTFASTMVLEIRHERQKPT